MTDLSRLSTALADRYRIERELGQGGMATVYLAHDLRHERDVAVKVLREDLSASLGSGRFLREIKIAAQLQHPHILPLLDSGEAAGHLYFVMPYIRGQSLRERLAREGELPVHEAIRLITEVVDALVEAHEHGVVHRDIKPDNVMLSGRHALVTDFGVAKAISEATGRNTVTTIGVAVGTPTYMSPEQAAADPHVDHRSDVYSVGVMLYEMLSGRPPFIGNTPQQVLAAHVTEAPDPVSKRRPAIPAAVEAIVMRCLAKRPADRFQTAAELLAVLEPLATPSTGITPTQTRPISAVTIPVRSSWLLRGLIGAAVVIVVAAAFLLVNRRPATAILQQAVQVTRTAGVQEAPLISADGKGVAYRVLGSGDTVRRVEFRRGSDGSAVPLVPAGSPLGWSPDGDGLLMATPRGLERVPTLGGTATLIVPGAQNGTWSPDGKRLAYVTGDSIVLRSGDAPPTFLVRNTDPHSLAWSPDGRWLAYVDGNSRYLDDWNIAPATLWLIPATGGPQVQLTADDALNLSPSWAPDSRRLLFVSRRAGSGDIYQLTLDGHGRPNGAAIPLTHGLNVSMLSLSADGTHLAYSVASNQSHVWSVAMPSTDSASIRNATQLTTDRESIESIWISHDGKWLYFDSDRAGAQQIFRMPLAGGSIEQITHGNSPAFSVSASPDGKEVGYHTILDGKRRAFVLAVDGAASPTQVSPGKLPDERIPIWSPDGSQLAWQVFDGSAWGLQVAARRSGVLGPVRTVSRPGLVLLPTWTDSVTLVAVDTISRRLMLVRVDSASIAPRALAVVNYSGSYGRKGSASNASLASDQRSLLVRQGHGLWLVPISGAPARELVRFDALHPIVGNARSYADYGGRLYFTLKDPESNIWVAPVTGLSR